MATKRIITNIQVKNLSDADEFYGNILGMEVIMDHGWIKTFGSSFRQTVQISFATEGGNHTPVPDISIEVENVDQIYKQMMARGFKITYPITDESWGVRRFFVTDPFGKCVNILSHQT